MAEAAAWRQCLSVGRPLALVVAVGRCRPATGANRDYSMLVACWWSSHLVLRSPRHPGRLLLFLDSEVSVRCTENEEADADTVEAPVQGGYSNLRLPSITRYNKHRKQIYTQDYENYTEKTTCAKMNLLCKVFRKLSSDRDTYIQNGTTPLRGWSNMIF